MPDRLDDDFSVHGIFSAKEPLETVTFQVMIQPHNRNMSFSLYISALAVSDTIVLLVGKNIAIS